MLTLFTLVGLVLYELLSMFWRVDDACVQPMMDDANTLVAGKAVCWGGRMMEGSERHIIVKSKIHKSDDACKGPLMSVVDYYVNRPRRITVGACATVGQDRPSQI